MNFRADINGLRAAAVALVVLYHFHTRGFEGGFVGVDIFFVISGFLMTGIIFNKLEKSTFSVWSFYLDRARRIVPALAVMCSLLIACCWFYLLPEEYGKLGKNALGAITFTSNHLFAKEVSYFDIASHENWLLHTWSLSVEWQFYIAYPVVILCLRRILPTAKIKYVLLICAAVSLLLGVYGAEKWPTNAFYLLPTRAWEMLSGGLIYLFPIHASSRMRAGMEMAGFAMIAYAANKFRSSDFWPGWLACIPVVGAALIIISSRSDSLITGNRFAQFLGKSSYSIYLYHWPIVVALRYAGRAEHTWATAGGIAASIVLGFLSMRFIESPSKKNVGEPTSKRAQESRSVVKYVVATSATAVSLATLVVLNDGFPEEYRLTDAQKRSDFLAYYRGVVLHGRAQSYHYECDFYDAVSNSAKSRIDPACTSTNENRPSIFIWGDSHAQALSLGLRAYYSTANVMQIATSNCPPNLPSTKGTVFRNAIPNNCDESNRFALQEIARTKPDTVLIAQRQGHSTKNWDAIAEQLRSFGVRKVILFGPIPTWSPSLPLQIAQNHWFDRTEYMTDGLEKRALVDDRKLKSLYQNSASIEYVSMVDALCKGSDCLTVVPGSVDLVVIDDGHLSSGGSLYAVKKAFMRYDASNMQ